MISDLRLHLMLLDFIDAAPADDVAWMMSHPVTDLGQTVTGAWFVGPSEGATLWEAATRALSRAARDIAHDVEQMTPAELVVEARTHAYRVNTLSSLLALTEPV